VIDRCEDCLQNACMPSISVRNVPEATRDALAAKAAQAGQSLQEYLLARLIELGNSREISAVLADMRAIRKGWSKPITRAQVLEAIDEGRREADEKWDRLWG
jgi:antitoxin FitA